MSETGVLIIHGFGGDPREIQPLADFLGAEGYSVQCVQLAGHTGKRKDMRGVTWRDWIASAQRELDSLKEHCSDLRVIGFSMGGLITIHLSLENRLNQIVLLSMPIFHWHRAQIVANVLGDIATGQWENIRHYFKSSVKFTLGALFNFRVFLHKTKYMLSQSKVPVYIAQGLKDDTVAPRSGDYIYQNIGSTLKNLKFYPNSDHLICTSGDQEELFQDVLNFLRSKNPVKS